MLYNYEQQHKKGKLHALERIKKILDAGSFCELFFDKEGQERKEQKEKINYDGVIVGKGTIHKKLVYIYSQDFTYKAGTLGEIHGRRIAYTIQMAIDKKCPVISINDSGGARIQEGIVALAGYGDLFYLNTKASGLIPQISIIAGPCAGGAVYSPGITDFIFTIDSISNMFVTGPKVIKSVTKEEVTAEELGGTKVHSVKSGVSHFRCDSEEECYEKVRKLIKLVPSSCEEIENYPVISKSKIKQISAKIWKKTNRSYDQRCILGIVPNESNRSYDIKKVIEILVDKDSFLEIQSEFAKNIVIGFAKLKNMTIGIVANQPNYMAGVLDVDSSDKAARFVRYCDCYSIPIVTLTDVPGFLPGTEQEYSGIIRHGAKLLYAYAEATTVKLNVILRKAYGGAYIAMSSRHLKADRVYAWPNAQIAVMGAEAAVEILYHRELNQLSNHEKKSFLLEKIKEYKTNIMNTQIAYEHGYIDGIIQPVATRLQIYNDICSISNKILNKTITKKHGNIPL